VAAPVGQDADGQRPIKTLGWGGVVCDALHGVVSLCGGALPRFS
jgi:hypothetical protein